MCFEKISRRGNSRPNLAMGCIAGICIYLSSIGICTTRFLRGVEGGRGGRVGVGVWVGGEGRGGGGRGGEWAREGRMGEGREGGRGRGERGGGRRHSAR